jgi:hypothetical protein
MHMEKFENFENFFSKSLFLPFYVLFWAFFGLDTESEHITALQCELHILDCSITLVSYEKILLYESVRNKFCVHGEIGQFSSF